MKSSTRSRSSATSGLGLKSIVSSPRSPERERYLIGASGPAVAGEELAILLQQPSQLHLDDPRERPLEDPRPLATTQLRRDRQEELVDQAVGLELLVNVRASLANDSPNAVVLPHAAQRIGE